jgi:hypothetical protein
MQTIKLQIAPVSKAEAMSELEFAAMLVSRVCHDLVSPVGAVVNGLEVLEDENDAAMRADALKLVTSSAEQAAARLQFARPQSEKSGARRKGRTRLAGRQS